MIVLSHKLAWINVHSRPRIIVDLLQSHLLCLGLMINLIMDLVIIHCMFESDNYSPKEAKELHE